MNIRGAFYEYFGTFSCNFIIYNFKNPVKAPYKNSMAKIKSNTFVNGRIAFLTEYHFSLDTFSWLNF